MLLAGNWPVHGRASCRQPMNNQDSVESFLFIYHAKHAADGIFLVLLSENKDGQALCCRWKFESWEISRDLSM